MFQVAVSDLSERCLNENPLFEPNEFIVGACGKTVKREIPAIQKPITSLINMIAATLGIHYANYRVVRLKANPKAEYTNATSLITAAKKFNTACRRSSYRLIRYLFFL
jgi:hypothetical protein